MKLITKLTIVCILISGLEKLVTYVSMRMFPYEIGEYNLLALRVLNVLGLELGNSNHVRCYCHVFCGNKESC